MTSNILHWNKMVSSFGTSNIFDIVTDGTTWVAVGESGKLATATDPKGTWTQRTSSFDTTNIRCIATDGTTWVAVGYSGKIATATDPTGTWIQATDSGFGAAPIYGIATDDTTWVAVGAGGKITTATDPTGTWSAPTESSFGTDYIRSVTTDGTTWCAVAYGNKIATATDPTGTWVQRSNDFTCNYLLNVFTDGTTWVAAGYPGQLATATDPTSTWTMRNIPFSENEYGKLGIYKVIKGNINWIAVGEWGNMATATDPTGTWTRIASNYVANATEDAILSITTDNDDLWTYVGIGGVLFTNRDVLEKAHYKFNETSGTDVLDNSGNNNTGTNNGATINQTGKINKAYNLESTNSDYINLNSVLISASVFSVNGWIKTSNASQDIITQWKSGTAGRTQMSIDGDGYIAIAIGGSTVLTGDVSVSDGVWNYIVIKRNSSNVLAIYVNGVLDNSATITTTIEQDTNTLLGTYSAGSYFNGLMDDFRIYDFALTEKDISLLYNSGNGTEIDLETLRNRASNFYTLSLGAEI